MKRLMGGVLLLIIVAVIVFLVPHFKRDREGVRNPSTESRPKLLDEWVPTAPDVHAEVAERVELGPGELALRVFLEDSKRNPLEGWLRYSIVTRSDAVLSARLFACEVPAGGALLALPLPCQLRLAAGSGGYATTFCTEEIAPGQPEDLHLRLERENASAGQLIVRVITGGRPLLRSGMGVAVPTGSFWGVTMEPAMVVTEDGLPAPVPDLDIEGLGIGTDHNSPLFAERFLRTRECKLASAAEVWQAERDVWPFFVQNGEGQVTIPANTVLSVYLEVKGRYSRGYRTGVRVEAGGTTEVVLNVSHLREISGTVRLGGNPTQADISVWPYDGGGSLDCKTDPGGKYRIGIPFSMGPRILLRVCRDRGINNEVGVGYSASFELDSGSLAVPFDIDLESTQYITVRVEDENRQPVAQALVSVGFMGPLGWTDEQGVCRLWGNLDLVRLDQNLTVKTLDSEGGPGRFAHYPGFVPEPGKSYNIVIGGDK